MLAAGFFAVLHFFNWLALFYFVILNIIYAAMTVLAFAALRRYARRLRTVEAQDLATVRGAPPITLIAPAFNEEATCVEATRALLTLKYPEYEVLVVNDGSRDATVARLVAAFDLVPADRMPTAQLPTQRVKQLYRSARYSNLWVIDKENGGKADALNTGLNYCRTPVFCAMDADTLLQNDALMRVARPFMENRDTIAVGGIIRIANGCRVEYGVVKDVQLPKNLIARLQVLEYLRAFLSGRMGWSQVGAMLIISGAFGLFRRPFVVDAGGFATDTVGEDMELVVRLHRYCLERNIPYRITFVPDPVAWTECPESLSVLGRQRDRWHRGLVQTLTRHAVMLFNPKYGRVGMVAFPYFFFLEMLGPVVEVGGYISFAVSLMLGAVNPTFAVVFVVFAFMLGILLSSAAVLLEELTFRRYQRFGDLVQLFLLAVVENFGYRQISSWWRLKGLLTARKKHTWGLMVRKGFNSAPVPQAQSRPT